MKYNKEVLENNIRVVTIPIQNVKSTTVLILVNTGSRYERLDNNGIAHFIEHMMFKGTQKRPSAVDISEEIDSLGADFNAFTSKEYTGYYIKSASDYVYQSIEILADMLINSRFDEAEWEKEKGVIIEEINMYADTPMRQIGSIYEDLIYEGHPLSYDTAGSKATVANLSRADALSFKEQWYSGDNIVVIVAGNIEHQKIINSVKQNLGIVKKLPTKQLTNIYKDTQSTPILRIARKNTDQAHFCIGMRSFEIGNQQRYAMSIFNTIMGGNMSSRLFVELREKRGLCYYISSDNDTYLDTGTWVIQAGVDIERYQEALDICLALLTETKQSGFSADEVSKAKQYLRGRMALGLEDSKGIANLYGINLLLEDIIRTPDDIINAINQVTVEQVNQLAKDIINKQKVSYAIIGPFEDKIGDRILRSIEKATL